ncbi:hypothetical protein [Sinorhizobium fredii]|uniref:hypothetical protein n=1 Tax=Rhizobium fredii TaxID=380 RepID=UPI003512D671
MDEAGQNVLAYVSFPKYTAIDLYCVTLIDKFNGDDQEGAPKSPATFRITMQPSTLGAFAPRRQRRMGRAAGPRHDAGRSMSDDPLINLPAVARQSAQHFGERGD